MTYTIHATDSVIVDLDWMMLVPEFAELCNLRGDAALLYLIMRHGRRSPYKGLPENAAITKAATDAKELAQKTRRRKVSSVRLDTLEQDTVFKKAVAKWKELDADEMFDELEAKKAKHRELVRSYNETPAAPDTIEYLKDLSKLMSETSTDIARLEAEVVGTKIQGKKKGAQSTDGVLRMSMSQIEIHGNS